MKNYLYYVLFFRGVGGGPRLKASGGAIQLPPSAAAAAERDGGGGRCNYFLVNVFRFMVSFAYQSDSLAGLTYEVYHE